MSGVVLDASALLALLLDEPGASLVAETLDEAAMSSVNLAEVIGYYAKQGVDATDIRVMLTGLPIAIVAFDQDLAYEVGLMRPLGEKVGLSLGDRACLALARQRGAPAQTADRAWKAIAEEYGVAVEFIRQS